MTWFALIMVLLPMSAFGTNLEIPLEPDQVEVQNIKFYRIAYGFQEDETKRFQVQVNVRYRQWTSPIEESEHFVFHLKSGVIKQKDDQTLVLYRDNREMVVGQHRWWYSPHWQSTDRVQIACDHYQKMRRVVAEHCRLVIHSLEDFAKSEGVGQLKSET